MSSALGLDLLSASAEDPPKWGVLHDGNSHSQTPSIQEEQLIAPDQFDPKWQTDKIEIWTYYAYYVGNNGLTLFNFAPTAFQNLLYQAAGDGNTLRFAGR